jgi:hypothetical protein
MTDKRNCLRCNTPFTSSGPGNRICSECNRINQRSFPMKVLHDPYPSTNIPEIILPSKDKFYGKEKKTKPKDSP